VKDRDVVVVIVALLWWKLHGKEWATKARGRKIANEATRRMFGLED